jgi:hypothetical protein
MMLRLAAALVAVTGAALLLAFLHLVGKGPFADPAARHLRAMKDRTAVPARAAVVDTAFFRALPHRAPLATVAALERRAVVLEGRVQHLLRSSDGDLHLELAAPGTDLNRRILAPYVTAELTPAFRRRRPDLTFDALAATLRPNRGSTAAWPGGPRRARVTGWLLYDFQYDAPVTEEQLRTGAPRLTGWEIHPVTRLEVWDEPRGAWTAVMP